MTRVTFGVSASPFAANMAVRQNAIDHASEFPLGVEAVFNSFYVDDGLTGAGPKMKSLYFRSIYKIYLSKEDFYLESGISTLPQSLRVCLILSITESRGYTKMLGVEWHSKLDHFRLAIKELHQCDKLTK